MTSGWSVIGVAESLAAHRHAGRPRDPRLGATQMTNTDVMKMTVCHKCGLEFNTLLHSFCLHEQCPVRGSRTMSELADEGMRQGRAISASTRVWEYEGLDGVWNECRNADDACMWAEDGRRIREKLPATVKASA